MFKVMQASMLLSFMHTAIPFAFRYYEKNILFGETAIEHFLCSFLFLMNFYFYFANTLFFVISIYELSR